MPIPSKSETKDEFINRCMSFDDMQQYETDQRYAIWNGLYESENLFNITYICNSHFAIFCNHFQPVTICNRFISLVNHLKQKKQQ